MDITILSLGFFAGLLLGAVIIGLWGKQKSASQLATLNAQLETAKNYQSQLSSDIEQVHLNLKEEKLNSSTIDRIRIQKEEANKSLDKENFNLLEKNEKIRTKKIDRALVAWPVEIEKLRSWLFK